MLRSLTTVFFTLFFAIVSQLAFCQSPVYVYKTKGDSTQNFYVKRVPNGPIRGLLAINLRSVSDSIKTYALDNGIMLLSLAPVKIDNALELLTSDLALDRIDKMIAEVMDNYLSRPIKL